MHRSMFFMCAAFTDRSFSVSFILKIGHMIIALHEFQTAGVCNQVLA